MSDRDPLQQLADFGSSPVTPLPAAEVRRRGDQRRARRTAVTAVAGVTAVLAVAVPAGIYATRTGDADHRPPIATRAPERTTIPDDFPLDRDAWDFGTADARQGPAANVEVAQPLPCSAEPLISAPVTERLGFRNPGEDVEEHRQLLLYGDEAAARGVLEQAAEALSRCSTERVDGITLTWTTREADTGQETLTFSQGVADGVGGTTFQLTRVGRAVLQVATRGEGSADVKRLSAVTRAIVPAMCGWAPEGCGALPTGAATGGPAVTEQEIAAGFPLAVGFPERSERGADGYTGPDRSLDPVALDACGEVLPDPAFRDRLVARYESAEDYRTRQLTTYPDADTAVAASRALVEAFRACPSEGPDADGYSTEREVQDLELGGESWALLTRATMAGGATPFGSTVIVVRIGRAVLVEDHGGHAGYPGPEGITELSERLAAPLAAMCAFTAAGC